MGDSQLNIWIKLRDQVSAQVKGVQSRLKTFATSFKANWLAITASITAGIIALRKAFDLIEFSARAKQQKQAFENLSMAVNVNSESMIKNLKKLSGETMSSMAVMEKASKAMILGLDPSKLGKMMEISRASARAFGTDVGFMFDSIAMGIGRQSRMILDNLGIIVQAEKAYKTYAGELGKTVEQLTDVERRTAFMNETMRAGELILAKVNVQRKTELEYLQSMKAFWEEFKKVFGNVMIELIKIDALWVKSLLLGATEVQKVFASIFSWIAERLAVASEFYGRFNNKIKEMGEGYRIAQRITEGWGNSAEESIKKQKKSMEELIGMIQILGKPSEDGGGGGGDAIRKKLEALMAGVGNVKVVSKDAFDFTAELGKATAQKLQSSFSEFFFKVFTGELRGMQDVFKGFGTAMMQMFSQLLAKAMLVKALEGSSLGRYLGFQTGTSYVPRTGMYQLHRGEKVIPEHSVADDGGGGGVNVTVNQIIQAWDASDVYRNRKALSSAIAEEIRNNSQIRDVMRRYG